MNYFNKISPIVDLTLLDLNATSAQLSALSREADQYHVACLCVYPQHLQELTTVLPIRRAAVVNFPSGMEAMSSTIETIQWMCQNQVVHEIDYVFPYQDYLNNQANAAITQCQRMIEFCKSQQLKIKVILETEVFPSMQSIYDLCIKLITLDCDFLKTSTGTKPIGATYEVAETILKAIRDSEKVCGLKVSGGVRTLEQAMSYINVAETMMQKPIDASWFRIGSSKLLQAIAS